MRHIRRFIIVSCGLLPLTALAASTSFTDVPKGVWFAEAVTKMAEAGYLDVSTPVFRPADPATRAEFVKLIVKLNGGVINAPPLRRSFDDVSASDWHFPYFEEAAKERWVQGENNCLGTRPCFARPASPITRAEAVALIVRAFDYEATGSEPRFTDVPKDEWYADAFATLADHCVILGDDATGQVRPNDQLTRAEMVMLLYRIDQALTDGTDCAER